MSAASKIEWTDATWNPWHGCHKISPGCKNCYMFREKKMYGQDPNVVVRSKTKFSDPLKWPDAKLVFTCSWSDWFIEEADPWRDEAWDIIRRTPQHTYQILTKRIERAGSWVPVPPLANVWLGASIEDRAHLSRIGQLRMTLASLRFLSLEPLLEDLGSLDLRGIDWVIVGGESGAGARPCDLAWIRSIVAQCRKAEVPVFVKQLGAVPYDRWKSVPVRAAGNTANGSTSVPVSMKLRDRKGGDMEEWPIDIRVREMPTSGGQP